MKFKTVIGSGQIICVQSQIKANVEFKIQVRFDTRKSHGVITFIDEHYKDIKDFCSMEGCFCFLEIYKEMKYAIRIDKKMGYIIPFTIDEQIKLSTF